MAKDLSPADDLLFKLIFGSQHSKRVLKHLLNSILAPTGTPIEEIEIENTEIVPEIFNGRGVRLDVRAKAEDGRLCDIEIQKANEGDMWERSMYYWASLCSRHLDKSQGFGLLKKTICINLLEFDITKNGENKDKFWSIYHVTEDSTGERYGKDLFEIHFLEMKKVHGVQKDCPITWWIEFLNNPLSDNIKEIVKFEPIIGEAVDMFNTVSKDPKTQELMRMREEGERNYISAMLCAEQRGIQLGKQEGIQLGKQEGIQLGKQEGIQLGKQEGIQLGKQEGIQLGERRSRIETARTMIAENIPLETVAKCTGLSMSELKTLE